MSLRVCAEPGCPKLTRTPRCEHHAREHRATQIAKGARPRGNTPELIRKVRTRDGNQCTRCHSTTRLRVHHIVEVRNGGTNDLANLVTLCHPCHMKTHHG